MGKNFAKFVKNGGALGEKALRASAAQVSNILGPKALNLFPSPY